MSDETDTEITGQLDTGDVKALNERWYAKVSETHVNMFVLIEQLGKLLGADGDETQKSLTKKLLEYECLLTGLDCYCSTTGASYTGILDSVRRTFSYMARAIETLTRIATERKQTEIVRVLKAIHEMSCTEADADCFKSLLNGYIRDIGCDDGTRQTCQDGS